MPARRPVLTSITLAAAAAVVGAAVAGPLGDDGGDVVVTAADRAEVVAVDPLFLGAYGIGTGPAEPRVPDSPDLAERRAERPAPVAAASASEVVAASGVFQRGEASWYGPGFAGNRTANGEIYDPRELTAAHRTLPFGTRVRVTNERNGQSVVVRINDRGPFIEGRVIDLSEAAAEVIGMRSAGVAPVTLEIVG